ncbi:MAG TPA: hypothetical protein VFI28_13175 [Candidatus Limnocylindrales bacterium]|nr:hypothetical protein [Candidatus Limnocylindrales bacterium]
MTTPQDDAFLPDLDDPLARAATPPSDPADAGRKTEPNRATTPDDEAELDPGEPHEPVGNDNIRDGTVGGVMGGPRQQQGQGQG